MSVDSASYLFVYGLLRPDAAPGPLRPIVESAYDVGEFRVPGLLFDHGEWPAATPGDSTIYGHLLRFNGPVDWGTMDAFEGCDADPPLFRRSRVPVAGLEACIYWYARPTNDLPRIESGRWERK